jgi:hypothetical protein
MPLLDAQAHGPEFRDACKRLGLPEQYSGASADLTSNDLDWRSEKRSDQSEKILERVRKLLALANSANEHEALLAMERVREIYAKYNLEQMKENEKAGYVHLVLGRGKKRMENWEARIASILATFFFVEVIFSHEFDAKSGEHHQAIEVIGTRENVLMAEYVYQFLLTQLQFHLSEAARGAKKFSRREYNSYRLGILVGFEKKLQEAERSQATEPMSENTLSRAITIFRRDKRIENYLREIYPRLTTRRRGAAAVVDHAFSAGRAVGATLNLNRPVTSTSQNLGRVLSGRQA